MAFVIATKDGTVVSTVGLKDATEENVTEEFSSNILPYTDLSRDDFIVYEVDQDAVNRGIRRVVLDEKGYPVDVELFPKTEIKPPITYDPIDPEKLAMAEAIIQHEMEIQQLKAELAALKKGEE